MANIDINTEELNQINELIAGIPDKAWQLYSKNISKHEQELEAKSFTKSPVNVVCQAIIIGRENYSGCKNNWKYRIFYFSNNDSISINLGKNTIKDRLFGNKFEPLILTLEKIFDKIYPLRIKELQNSNYNSMIIGLKNIKESNE